MRLVALSGILLTLFLAGCGFQLRGQADLPPELAVVYIQSIQGTGLPPGVLSRRLQTVLVGSGVRVVRDPAQATATITILNEGSGRRAVAAPSGCAPHVSSPRPGNHRSRRTSSAGADGAAPSIALRDHAMGFRRPSRERK